MKGTRWLNLATGVAAVTFLCSGSCHVSFSVNNRPRCDPGDPNCNQQPATSGTARTEADRWRIESYRALGPTAIRVLEGPRDERGDPIVFTRRVLLANPGLLGPGDARLEGSWRTAEGVRVAWVRGRGALVTRLGFLVDGDGVLVAVERVPLFVFGWL